MWRDGLTAFIRPYQPGDREALLNIGADTAFFGEPIEHYMEDRTIFMDSFYSYYTDYEPQHAWVACEQNRVVGFLTGAVNSHKHARIMQQRILPAVLGKFLRARYRPGMKTWRYTFGVFRAVLRKEFPPVSFDHYPAHLHINILPHCRGLGLGRQLLEAYLSQLEQLHVLGVHLKTTDRNTAACHLYERIGFRMISARPSRMYAGFINEPLELRCYGMDLPRSRKEKRAQMQ
jgi:ribosomal protein S18 acetylase RimI-like enzyme